MSRPGENCARHYESPDAWPRLVERLLESQHYGERWARHWLDVVRFAETCGYERDQVKEFVWKYRDWVVEAFNSDMPYDRFILEQLAGDELPEPSERTVIATGFLRLGSWNDEPNDPQDYKYERLEDLVHATSSAFLGLTVKCARCHDHKFDPVPQVDYYRMAAAFWAGPIEPRGNELLGGPTPEELGFKGVHGWTDLGLDPGPLQLLKNGDRHHPRQAIGAGPLSLVPAMFQPFAQPPEGAKTSHRRLQLAQWIASAENPLTARVAVNRIWQHHFGQGLVRSPNNFGFRGDPPTHPELLDWLAARFIEGGWKSKPLHRLILASSAYRQASLHPRQDEYKLKDFGNRHWWRAERRRLDAEALRDSMLSVTGEIDLRTGGPSFRPTISTEALEGLSRKSSAWQASPRDEQRRRSLYIFSKRGLLPPMMTAFDFCDTTVPCGQRDVTIVPPQALALLNNRFSHDRNTALARRVLKSVAESSEAPTPADLVVQAWRLALGRDPDTDEIEAAVHHVAAQRARLEGLLAGRESARQIDASEAAALQVYDDLVLHLRADGGVGSDAAGRVDEWQDRSRARHPARQPISQHRPVLVDDVMNGHPVIRFDGQARFLALEGQLLNSQQFSIFAVASDRGSADHREILSNWNGAAGNSISSVFLGLTAERTVRFSDSFAAAGEVASREQPFLLTAINSDHDTVVYQNGTRLASRGSPLDPRNLDTPWVIAQQGNIGGEFWNGDIAEILVYNRALDDDERLSVWRYLLHRYQLPPDVETFSEPAPDPELLAWASLCHVLLNSNEFIYVD